MRICVHLLNLLSRHGNLDRIMSFVGRNLFYSSFQHYVSEEKFYYVFFFLHKRNSVGESLQGLGRGDAEFVGEFWKIKCTANLIFANIFIEQRFFFLILVQLFLETFSLKHILETFICWPFKLCN